MAKDYYSILGLKKDASEDDIKKAYKKAAIKYHPDKYASKSQKEQDEASEKFKEINEAYQILSDPQKKSNYDNYGDPEGGPSMGDFFRSNGFGFDMGDFFNGGFNPFGGGRRKPTVQAGQSLKYNLSLSIEEIFNGCNKTISYVRQVRCSTCNGEGGKGVKTCSHCGGTGQIVHTERHGYSTVQSITTCPHCGGTGKTVSEKCSSCNGTGFKTVTENITIQVPTGIQEGTPMKYGGKGSESKDKNGPSGDLHIIITWGFDKSKYQINNRDVYELIKVPYYDCILGKEIEHRIPSGEKIKIKIPECSDDGKQIRIKGKGLKGIGDYIVVISPEFPKTLTKEQRSILEKLR
jgi:molecular chaperone DnaJ